MLHGLPGDAVVFAAVDECEGATRGLFSGARVDSGGADADDMQVALDRLADKSIALKNGAIVRHRAQVLGLRMHAQRFAVSPTHTASRYPWARSASLSTLLRAPSIFTGATASACARCRSGLPIWTINILSSVWSARAVRCVYNTKDVVIAARTQLPLVLSWAATVHAVQGLTLAPVALHIPRVWAWGQLYVAMSRSPSARSIFLRERPQLDEHEDYIHCREKVSVFLTQMSHRQAALLRTWRTCGRQTLSHISHAGPSIKDIVERLNSVQP